MGCSSHLITFLNFFTAVLSLPIIGTGVWLATKHSSECLHFLQWPLLISGVFLLVVSVAGLVGTSCRILCLLWLYLAIMFLLILLLAAFTAFAFVVTNSGAGDAISGRGFLEYHLGNYSSWLQRRVDHPSNWRPIRSCLSDARVCNDLNTRYPTAAAFDSSRLSPLQSGCCKPPTACDFTFLNATSWVQAKDPNADKDCSAWSNDPSKLCFDCDSCRAGVLQTAKEDWRKVAIINVVVLVLIITVYSIGCSAFRNARRDDYSK
ncbi:hypothetical protein KP509_19G060900 [Ceratopteris richardii]|uniref:Tetraspanin-8 n=1 Tax=Ceratopteris richardii TaxID=49495 RepID=A0A8T2SKZ5_CERRI|nr:hypothetical protein KP509_19G060900 [Ceratopteris richardii]